MPQTRNRRPLVGFSMAMILRGKLMPWYPSRDLPNHKGLSANPKRHLTASLFSMPVPIYPPEIFFFFFSFFLGAKLQM